ATGQGAHSVTYNVPGEKVVSVIIVDGNGCENVITQNITVTESTTCIAIFSNDLEVCLGEEITFTDGSIASVGGILNSWTWDFGSGASPATIDSQGPHNITYSTSGEKTVELTITDNGGCTNIITATITVNALPIVTINAPGTAEQGTAINIGGTGTNIDTWTWDFGDNAIPGTATGQGVHAVTYNVPGEKIISVTITDSNGCSNTITQGLTVTGSTTCIAIFSNDLEVCLNEEITFTDGSIASVGGILNSWEWDFDVEEDPSTASPPTASSQGPHGVIYSTAGEKTVELTITDNGNCTYTRTTTITVNPLPQIEFIIVSGNLEPGESITIDAEVPNEANIDTWTWDFGDDATPANATGIGPHIVVYDTEGSQTITLGIIDASGCVNNGTNGTTTIEIGDAFCLPIINMDDFEFGDTICRGDILILDGTASEGSNDAVIDDFVWKIDGSVESTLASYPHEFLNIGENIVTLTVANTDNDCLKDSIDFIIFVDPIGLLADISDTGSSSPYCLGQQINLVGQVDRFDYVDEFLWSLDGEPILVDGNPLSTENPVINLEVGSNEDFDITIFSQNDNGCVDEYTQSFIVDESSLNTPPISEILKLEKDGGTVLLYNIEDLCYDWYSQPKEDFNIGLDPGNPITENTDPNQDIYLSDDILQKSQYITFKNGIDTMNNVYWVEVWGNGTNCVPRSGCEYRIYLNNTLPSILINGFQVPAPDPKLQLTLYPNPNSGTFTLKIEGQEEGQFNYIITDNLGRHIMNGQMEKESIFPGKYTVGSDHLADGLYFLNIITPSGEREVRKFIVQH
ncbi:MAG: PKD repeat protein, partial [Saprospiraceae bacterium]